MEHNHPGSSNTKFWVSTVIAVAVIVTAGLIFIIGRGSVNNQQAKNTADQSLVTVTPDATQPSNDPEPEEDDSDTLLYQAQPTAPVAKAQDSGQVLAAATQAGINTTSCSGYAEKRVFLESQAWWSSTAEQAGHAYGNVSLGTCFPQGQKVSGTIPFDLRVTIYENPGTLNTVEVQMFGSGGGAIAGRVTGLKATCPNDGTCTTWYHINANTAALGKDGREEFRFHAIVTEPDGKTLFNSTGWQATVSNGNAVSDYRSTDNFVEARSWYTGTGYTNARLDSAVPTGPVSGTWTFHVSLKPGSGGKPVTHNSVSLDADFQKDNPGTVLEQGNGPFTGTVSLNTAKLTNGTHKLVLRSDADASSLGGTSSGVQIIQFTVGGGAGGGTPTPTVRPPTPTPTKPGTTPTPKPPTPTPTKAPTPTPICTGCTSTKNPSADASFRENFLKFDLSTLTQKTVKKATLRIWVASFPGGAAIPVSLVGTTDGWTETGLRATGSPALGAAIATGNVSASGWLTLDVTSYVNAQLAGDKVMSSVLIDNSSDNRSLIFNSRESATNKPSLDLQF